MMIMIMIIIMIVMVIMIMAIHVKWMSKIWDHRTQIHTVAGRMISTETAGQLVQRSNN